MALWSVRPFACAAGLATLVAHSSAFAQSSDSPSPSPQPTEASASPSAAPPALDTGPHGYGHRRQISLRVAGSEGYAFAVRYAGSPVQCQTVASAGATGDAMSDQFCHGRSALMLDAALGYGLLEDLEIELRFRFGEPVLSGQNPLAAGIGIRKYGNDHLAFKFVFGAAVFVDFTQTQYLNVLARLELGLHYDVARQFGFYFQLAATAGFVNALAVAVDGGLGIQARFP